MTTTPPDITAAELDELLARADKNGPTIIGRAMLRTLVAAVRARDAEIEQLTAAVRGNQCGIHRFANQEAPGCISCLVGKLTARATLAEARAKRYRRGLTNARDRIAPHGLAILETLNIACEEAIKHIDAALAADEREG